MKLTTKLWIALGVLILLSPLGLVLPDLFKAGSAWGEWGADEVRKMVGYVPQGMAEGSERWKAPLPDYAFKGWQEKGLAHLSLAYIASGLLGVAVIALAAWAIGRCLTKKGERSQMARKDFAERSIQGALTFFKEAIYADETAGLPGALQSLDPRIKIVMVLLCLLLVLFTRSLAVLAVLYLLAVLLAAASRIRLVSFLKRTWIFIPLFSLVIAIPAVFSFVSPGESLLSAGAFHITRRGVMAAGFLVGRVVASVSVVVLLSMTTRHFDLLKALRYFGIPQVFVMILGICYRYLYLFVEIVENTHRAIRSRIGSGMHYRKGQRIVAWNIAYLWLRSYRLNEQVYSAMVARGFRGEPIALNHFRAQRRDWFWLFGSVALLLLLGVAEYRSLL